jgi:phosphatidylglycerol:prolipoprotein diacylglycerol transferase
LWLVADEVAVTVPFGIFLWRIANFLNNELYGYPWYYGPFAMVHLNIHHFPSPLLESLLEGLLLWAVLLALQKRQLKTGMVASLFLIGYSLSRLIVELFFRLPDPQIWYLWGGFSMGSWLSFVVLLTGIAIALYIQLYASLQRRFRNAHLRNWQ